MRQLLRPLATLTLLALHAGSWAGPVAATAADDVAAGGATAAVTPAGLSAHTLGDGAAQTAASSPSGSALAAELINEAGAGVNAPDAPQRPRREEARGAGPSASHALPAARGQAAADDDPWGLRELGKATVHWVKETLPWLRSDTDEQERAAAVHDAADWSASPLDRDARHAPNRPPAASPTVDVDAIANVANAGPARVFDPEQNVIRVVINTLREVLEHPMTWLVVSLFVIGAVVVKRIDRRPTK